MSLCPMLICHSYMLFHCPSLKFLALISRLISPFRLVLDFPCVFLPCGIHSSLVQVIFYYALCILCRCSYQISCCFSMSYIVFFTIAIVRLVSSFLFQSRLDILAVLLIASISTASNLKKNNISTNRKSILKNL